MTVFGRQRGTKHGRWSVFLGLGSLLATSIFWAILSARLQNSNADQLIDGRLFESRDTLQAASFPGAHSFLLKWPLFALAGLLHNTLLVTTILTVICALVPVAAIAYVVWRVDPRPKVFALWCLVLSSMLLLVPAQAAPGVLLPVNFAMFTTRNLEYGLLLFIVAMLGRTRHLKSWSALAVLLGSALLIVSDALFAPLLLGGVGLAFMYKVLRHKLRLHRVIRYPEGRWFMVVLASFLLASAAVVTINSHHWTHLTTNAGNSPYALVTAPKRIAEAGAYAALDVMTLFGANPIYYHASLSGLVPSLRAVLSWQIAGYIWNAMLLLAVLVLALRFMWQRRAGNSRSDITARLLLMMAAVSLVIFVVTDHYYPVDSRYLTTVFIAGIVAAAAGLRTVRRRPRLLNAAVALLTLALPLSLYGAWQQYIHSRQALAPQVSLSQQIASQLQQRHIGVLIGNYWDVLPIQAQSQQPLQVVPLDGCTQPQVALSSRHWQQVAAGSRVAYLVNNDTMIHGFAGCSKQRVEMALGRASRSVPVSEIGYQDLQLLVYNRPPKAIVHLPTKSKKTARCQHGIMNIVAHEDDDLLFMNPDLQTAIDAHRCVTTVVLTAGDAGADRNYWFGRETGSLAAYTLMTHSVNDTWHKQRRLINGQPVPEYTSSAAPNVSLYYLHLPDGNVDGGGFAATHFTSLATLRFGTVNSLRTVDDARSYTAEDLTATLRKLMELYRPDEVRTLNFNHNPHDGDHSDHHMAGYFAERAFDGYAGNAQLKAYAGYPGSNWPVNVHGSQLANKEAAFFIYAAHDGATCSSVVACNDHTAYGPFLLHQYSRLVDERAITSEKVAHERPHAMGIPHRCTIGGKPLIQCVTNEP